MMRCKRAVLALVALLIPGCSRGPSLQDVFDGEVAVPAEELEALRSIFKGVRASKVPLGSPEGLLAGEGGHGLEVEGGQVTVLATAGEVDARALSALKTLRRLVLHQPELRTLDGLGPWPQLERLSLRRMGKLESLEGIGTCCPSLRELSISNAPVDDLSPLRDLSQLQSLRLEDSDLEDLRSAPSLPALHGLYLTGGPLASLEGLEAFPNLSKLLLFGTKQLTALDLPPHGELKEIELHQTGITALSGLPELPRLQRIQTSDNRILRVQLGLPPQFLEEPPVLPAESPDAAAAGDHGGEEEGLPSLRMLELHEKDLLSVDLGRLPGLQIVDLEGSGYLFKDGGKLHRLVVASQPALEKLDLRRNLLQDLSGLAPQPALRRIDLDHNPIKDLSPLFEGFPALGFVSVRRTQVGEVPEALQQAGVSLGHDPREMEATYWEGVLREAFEARRETFVEELPPLGGSVRGHRARCSLKSATFSVPRLNCTGSIDTVSGLVYLPLVKVDPLIPAAGVSSFPVSATIRTRKGRVRIYLKYEHAPRCNAEALAGYRDPEAPIFQWGDGEEEGKVIRGYSFAEATPGQPGSTSGEAHQLVDHLIVWIEGFDGAEGVEYVLEAPYR